MALDRREQARLSIEQAQKNLEEARARIAEIDVQIDELRRTREAYARSRESLRRYLAEPPSGRHRNGGDVYLVPRGEILPHVERAIFEHDAEHGRGGQAWLAAAADVSAKTIRNIINGTVQHVSWATADDLLSAMGRSYLLHTGEVKVVLNRSVRGGLKFHQHAVPGKPEACDD